MGPFTRRLKDATSDLIAESDSPELVKPLEEAASAKTATSELPSVKALPLRPNIPRHVQIDYLLRRAINTLNIHSNGPALKLALGYSLGELTQLCAVVDEIIFKGGKSSFTKALVGVWKVKLPTDTVFWLEDASTTAKTVKELVGHEVIDKTPQGRLEYRAQPLQYPDADITQGSSANRVRSLVRGFLAQYPQANKVGIITQQCHVADIETPDPLWKNRIARIEYLRTGEDRASNSWLERDAVIKNGRQSQFGLQCESIGCATYKHCEPHRITSAFVPVCDNHGTVQHPRFASLIIGFTPQKGVQPSLAINTPEFPGKTTILTCFAGRLWSFSNSRA